MSLVTRCTSCGTLFKVVADQLKISEGWVRCGQCATVFDAQANLVESTVAATPVAQQQAPGPIIALPAQQEQAPVSQSPSSQPSPEEDMTSDMQAFRDSKLQGSGLLAEYVSSQMPALSVPEKAWQEPFEAVEPASSSILCSDEPTTFFPASGIQESVLPQQEAAQQIEQQQLADPAPIAAPSFVVQAQHAQRWRSPAVRFVLSLLGLALLALLALQIALHDKDAIAARWPQAKPWLDKLCTHAGCKVEALRRIEAITVDASSFNRINKNNPQLEAITQSYRLAVTLKNTDALPVALPHVELSLQDAQDQPILRRVLSPADLGASMVALGAAQDMAGSITLQIDTAQLAGSRIQGYRVLAFYP